MVKELRARWRGFAGGSTGVDGWPESAGEGDNAAAAAADKSRGSARGTTDGGAAQKNGPFDFHRTGRKGRARMPSRLVVVAAAGARLRAAGSQYRWHACPGTRSAATSTSSPS
jgi:hypothetical protein